MSLELAVVPAHSIVNTPVKLKVAMESGDDVTLFYDLGTGASLVSRPRTSMLIFFLVQDALKYEILKLRQLKQFTSDISWQFVMA